MEVRLKILYFTLVLSMELLFMFGIISMFSQRCRRETTNAITVIVSVFVIGTMFSYLMYLYYL